MAAYYIHQKITAFANQYRIYEDKDGQQGELIAFAHQKRLALKEQITFYADESKQTVAFTLKARNVMEIAGTYDVDDGNGERLGTLRKQFKASLFRSTWNLYPKTSEDAYLVCQERSPGLAVLRRIWGFIPLVGEIPFPFKYHFDFNDPVLKTTVAEYNKITLFRDHYRLRTEDAVVENIDWRVLVAQGVALDALQSR